MIINASDVCKISKIGTENYMYAIGPIVSTSVDTYKGNKRCHGCGPYHFSPLDLLFSPGDVFHVVTSQKTTILMSFPGSLRHAQIFNDLTADHVIWRTEGLEMSPQLS